MKHFWHATAEQPPSSSRTSRVQGSNTGITAIACIKAGSLCAWSLGDSLWSHGMRMVETTYISLITYNYGLHIIMNNDILYDQLIMFTTGTGILWLLIIPPLLVHAIIWYMYILIYIYIYMMGILKLDSTIPLSHGGITSHSCLRHCIQSSLNSCHDLWFAYGSTKK